MTTTPDEEIVATLEEFTAALRSMADVLERTAMLPDLLDVMASHGELRRMAVDGLESVRNEADMLRKQLLARPDVRCGDCGGPTKRDGQGIARCYKGCDR